MGPLQNGWCKAKCILLYIVASVERTHLSADAIFAWGDIMSWCVYMHVFPNGKRYIGAATGNGRKRWGAGGNKYSLQPLVWSAIQEFGWDNIEHLIVASELTHEEALRMESALIKEYKTFPPELGFGYNSTSGGFERTPTDEVRARIGSSVKKMWEDEDFKKRMSELHSEISARNNNVQYLIKHNQEHGPPHLGKHLSLEHRQHLSAALKGKKPWNTGTTLSDEHRAKLSAIRKGKKQSPELVEKRVSHSRKKVRCVETGVVYNSQREAAKSIGIRETAICKCILGDRKTAGGFHWERVE